MARRGSSRSPGLMKATITDKLQALEAPLRCTWFALCYAAFFAALKKANQKVAGN